VAGASMYSGFLLLAREGTNKKRQGSYLDTERSLWFLACWHIFIEVTSQQSKQMPGRILSLADRMSPVRIGHECEGLIQFDQFVHKFFCSLVVTIVISGPVNDQKVSLQSCGMSNR